MIRQQDSEIQTLKNKNQLLEKEIHDLRQASHTPPNGNHHPKPQKNVQVSAVYFFFFFFLIFLEG